MYFLSGQKKITLKSEDLSPLIEQANSLELPISIHSNDENVPLLMVIGPAANNEIDKVTGNLKLYSWKNFS